MLKTAARLLITCVAFSRALQQHRTVGTIENGMFIEQTIIQHISYLRLELQQACVGLVIHWSHSVDGNDVDRMNDRKR